MGRSLNGTLNLIGIGAGLAKNAAKQPPGGPQRAGSHSGGRGLELRHEAVAAAVAEKLELKSFVSRMVGVVSGELYERHFEFGPPGAR